MSTSDPDRPDDELNDVLFAAARADAPPEASLHQALELVDSAYFEPRAGKRWLLWALPAAAVLLGSAVLIIMRAPGTTEIPVAAPPTTVLRSAPPTAATATAVAVVPLPPTASASASSSVRAVAVKGPLRPYKAKKAAAPATAKKPAHKSKAGAACPCAPSDMMCQMQKCAK